ncbi:MAG TPA: membrane dipeptidase [Roseiflexaceae bacterium]|nr:membrane dipeptidase [Roseiflexaceae bacterium]
MLIVDAHLDLAWNALQWERDLLLSAYTIRTREPGVPGPGRGQGTVALPELRRGRVALCFATLLARSTGSPAPQVDYLSPTQAFAVARGQLAYYRALERQGHARIICDRAALEAHWAAWEAYDGAESNVLRAESGDEAARSAQHAARSAQRSALRLGFVIAMESADPILAPEELADWHAAGVRVIGPAHYGPGRYAGGTGTELGLTERGVALLAEMERLGIILDVTHLSDQAFWQALERYGGPVLASHNNCRALVPHQRQFSDEQLRALIARGAVIGAACDNWMVVPGWRKDGSPNPPARLAHVVDHIDHICQLAGSSAHAAIGSDLDGGFGREQSPLDLDTIADLQQIAGLLAARGYAEADIAAIMHGNWVGLLRRCWG